MCFHDEVQWSHYWWTEFVFFTVRSIKLYIALVYLFLLGQVRQMRISSCPFLRVIFLPPSVSSVTFYIQLHFLTEPQGILNFTHHPRGHHTVTYGFATCMHAKHCYYYYYYFTLVFHHHYYYLVTFLGMLAKFPKVSTEFIISPCLSVCPRGTTWLLLDRFSWNLGVFF
jgi:hypothetical protein